MRVPLDTLPEIQKAIWDLYLKFEDKRLYRSLNHWDRNGAGYLTPIVPGDRLAMGDGTALLPEYSFLADQNTGMYRVGDDEIGFTAAGAQVAGIYNDVTGAQILLVDGDCLIPSYSFLNERDTGIYRVGANELGFAASGALVASIYGNLATERQIRLVDGVVTRPAYSFLNDTNLGFYRVGIDTIGVALANALDFQFSPNQFDILSGSHIEMADDTWIGFTAGGQLVWDSTPAVDEIRVVSANLDLNDNDLIMDADGDCIIHSIFDDRIAMVLPGAGGRFEININGANDFIYYADEFSVEPGSHIRMYDDTYIGTGACYLLFDETPVPDQIRLVGGDFHLNGNLMIIDADGDCSLYALFDDWISLDLPLNGTFEIFINGATDFLFYGDTFEVLAGSHIEMADDTWIGATAGCQIEFDTTPAVDEINFLNCYSGWGISAPTTVIHIYRNDALTTPQFLIEQDSTGDASFEFLLTGGQSYTIGIDNSETGDIFKISPEAALSNNDYFCMNSSGYIGHGCVPTYFFDVRNARVAAGVLDVVEYLEADLTNNAQANYQGVALWATLLHRGTQSESLSGRGSRVIDMSAFNYNTGTTAYFGGFRLDLRNLSTGTISNGYGVWVPTITNSGGGVVTYFRGFRVDAQTAANINIAYEGNIASGANRFNCYMIGTAENYFAGHVWCPDNVYLQIGSGRDAIIYYNSTDMIVNPKLVGAGVMLLDTNSKTCWRDTAIGAYSQADTFLDIFADGAVRIGDSSAGAPTNYIRFASNGDQSFVGTSGFYPRTLNQAAEPAPGLGATELDTGELCIWTDTDDSKCYLCYNHGGTVKTVELA